MAASSHPSSPPNFFGSRLRQQAHDHHRLGGGNGGLPYRDDPVRRTPKQMMPLLCVAELFVMRRAAPLFLFGAYCEEGWFMP
jgi:hypothetical protein